MTLIQKQQADQKARIAGLYGGDTIKKSDENELEKGGKGSGKYDHKKHAATASVEKKHLFKNEYQAEDAFYKIKDKVMKDMDLDEDEDDYDAQEDAVMGETRRRFKEKYGYDDYEDIDFAKSEDVSGWRTPKEHQELVKSQIANTLGGERLSEEELTKSAAEHFEKGGKAAAMGEQREFGGKKYIKTANGWRPVGKNGGKYKTAADTVHGASKYPNKDYKPESKEQLEKDVRAYNAKSSLLGQRNAVKDAMSRYFPEDKSGDKLKQKVDIATGGVAGVQALMAKEKKLKTQGHINLLRTELNKLIPAGNYDKDESNIHLGGKGEEGEYEDKSKISIWGGDRSTHPYRDTQDNRVPQSTIDKAIKAAGLEGKYDVKLHTYDTGSEKGWTNIGHYFILHPKSK